MPVINIYLSKDLFELVKQNKSRIIQQALREYAEKARQGKKRNCTAPPAEHIGTLPESHEESG